MSARAPHDLPPRRPHRRATTADTTRPRGAGVTHVRAAVVALPDEADGSATSERVHEALTLEGELRPGDEGWGAAVSESARAGGHGQRVSEAARGGADEDAGERGRPSDAGRPADAPPADAGDDADDAGDPPPGTPSGADTAADAQERRPDDTPRGPPG